MQARAILYAMHWRADKAQTSLRIRAVSPEPCSLNTNAIEV